MSLSFYPFQSNISNFIFNSFVGVLIDIQIINLRSVVAHHAFRAGVYNLQIRQNILVCNPQTGGHSAEIVRKDVLVNSEIRHLIPTLLSCLTRLIGLILISLILISQYKTSGIKTPQILLWSLTFRLDFHKIVARPGSVSQYIVVRTLSIYQLKGMIPLILSILLVRNSWWRGIFINFLRTSTISRGASISIRSTFYQELRFILRTRFINNLVIVFVKL